MNDYELDIHIKKECILLVKLQEELDKTSTYFLISKIISNLICIIIQIFLLKYLFTNFKYFNIYCKYISIFYLLIIFFINLVNITVILDCQQILEGMGFVNISNIIINLIITYIEKRYNNYKTQNLYKSSELFIQLNKLKELYRISNSSKKEELLILINKTIDLINNEQYSFIEEYKYLLDEYEKLQK